MPRERKVAAEPAEEDPNKLVRQQAGTYRTTDERFEVRQAGVGWFLVDREHTDELGQELMRGPFVTLNAVREAIPEARRTTLTSLPRPKATAKTGSAAARRAKPRADPPAPKRTWIDELPAAEASSVRALIRALEREGIDDAEKTVQKDRSGNEPMTARRIVETRLLALVADLPERERDAGRRLVQRVVELLTADGAAQFKPLPGWILVELGPEHEPANRRIVIRRLPKP